MIQGEPQSRGGLAVGFPMQAGISQPNPKTGFIVAKRLWKPHPEMRGEQSTAHQLQPHQHCGVRWGMMLLFVIICPGAALWDWGVLGRMWMAGRGVPRWPSKP